MPYLKMKIGTRLIMGFGVILAVIMITLFITLNSVNTMLANSILARDKSMPLTLLVDDMTFQTLKVMEQLLYASTTRQAGGFKEAEEVAEGFRVNLEQLRQMYLGKNDKKSIGLVDALAPAFERYYEQGKDMAFVYFTEGVEEGNRLVADFENAARLLTSAMEGLQETEIARTKNSMNNIVTSADMVRGVMLILNALAVVLSFLIAFFLTRSITNPLQDAVRFADAIAEGDMKQRLDMDKTDEIGQLAGALNTMADGLEEKAVFADRIASGDLSVKVKIASDKDTLGKALRAMVSSLDVMVRELRKAKDGAEAASLSKSQFLANMSHEIRTPMNAVIGFTDMLLETGLDKTQQEHAATIKSSGETLLSLINDILDFSKIEAGELVFEEIEFDPELLAHDVCEIIRPRIGSKPVEILCRIGEDVPSRIKGDPVRFRQVLTNLMDNASKFTEAGEIDLGFDVEEEGEGWIKLHVKIRDTGVGIPKDQLKEIFNPFHQADGSTTRKYGGTGLGLSICRNITALLGGEIRVESPVNGPLNRGRNAGSGDQTRGGPGSLFHFTARFGKIKGRQTRKIVPVSFSGKRIFIVDDNRSNLEVLTAILDPTGMRVTALADSRKTVPTLRKALEAGDPFHLCILDIQMPEMSGFDVARAIRGAESPIRDLPLIALSSLMDREAKKCEQAGFDGFLSKPIRRQRLYKMLERIIDNVAGKDDTFGYRKEQILTQYSIREEMKHSLRILLVEDNPVNQKLAKMILTKAGYHVKTADNGQEAVALYTASPGEIDFIFMDIQMPEMDGLEATKKIRVIEAQNRKSAGHGSRNNGIERVPIVAMTAHAMTGDREKCLAAGMDDYITKPIKREMVFEVIDKWVLSKVL